MFILQIFASLLITLFLVKVLMLHPLSISQPSERGMHNQPVPSSGGLAILGSYLAITIYAYVTHNHGISLSSPIIGIFLISMIGYFDDKYKLSKIARFSAQAGISLLVILSSSDNSLTINFLWLLFFLYFINIYNFMDGIDGLATSEAIFILLSFSLLNNFYSIEPLILFIIPLIIFLFYNLSPSKIFLGNAGSYLVGMLLAILIFRNSLIPDNVNNISHFASILIILTVFIGDASYTLLTRFLHKYRSCNNLLISLKHITSPHNVHNYQILAKRYKNHNKVNLYLMAYNIFWCFPLVLLNQEVQNLWFIFILLSYIPYIVYCHINNAGKE